VQKRQLTDLKNIGKTLAEKLNEIEIYTKADLNKVGAAKAYQWLNAKASKKLPVCYYLYSLEGALQDKDWRDLSESQKQTLKRQAGL